MIIDLARAQNVEKFGGKAVALGKLLREKIQVPCGFVVSADVNFPLDEKNREEIFAKFDEIFAQNKNQKVAVRSSGAREDGAKKSFAGQFDTFLNVAKKDLFEKIEQVAKSSAGKNFENYSEKTDAQIAVIVQEMVAAEISGVAFLANVVSGNRGEILIEAVNGLGEKLVGGEKTPDLFFVEKNSGKILAREIGAEKIILSEKNLQKLIKIIKQIEILMKYPADIEWAFAKNQFYILQTRPITTLNLISKKEKK